MFVPLFVAVVHRVRFVKLEQPPSMASMFVTFAVLSELKSKVSSAVQLANMLLILVTFCVLVVHRVRSFRDEHP